MDNNSLSLKEFIENALIDINSAVVNAHEKGVQIAYNKYDNGIHPKVQTVEFDIAVQVSNNNENITGKSAGLSISVVRMNIGKNKKNIINENLINRIKFSVEVFLGMKPIDE